MLILIFLIIATVFVAYANGANDNFKGVATLFGSKSASYHNALTWATITTLMGGVVSIFFAQELVKRFSGKGLVPDALTTSPEFLLAVAVGAALTVILATLTGFPISTTHSLTGALVGAGLMAVGSKINLLTLGSKFFLPLLLSPLLAATLAAIKYRGCRWFRIRQGITHDTGIYFRTADPSPPAMSRILNPGSQKAQGNVLANEATAITYQGTLLGINAQRFLDISHYLSAGLVSFARGLNDTPKIVALLLGVKALGIQSGMVLVVVAMAVGGILNATRVAKTMSYRITRMNPGQGFAANVVTGFLVIFASRWGMPVSTTHVSVGSLMGVGALSGNLNRRVSGQIILSWVLTLPISALVSALIYLGVTVG
ncbi:MAG: anion permease [Calditrichaeota bacterium]|nr:MAG: anion permease [Calditrichota bacterium]